MIRYATLDDERRIRATTIPMVKPPEPVEDEESDVREDGTPEYYPPDEGQFVIDFPEDFDFGRQQDWKWIDDTLAYDPLPEPEPSPDYTAFLMGLMEGYDGE